MTTPDQDPEIAPTQEPAQASGSTPTQEPAQAPTSTPKKGWPSWLGWAIAAVLVVVVIIIVLVSKPSATPAAATTAPTATLVPTKDATLAPATSATPATQVPTKDATLAPATSATPATQVPTKAATSAPATSAATAQASNNVCFILGGRWFDFAGKGYESIAVVDREWLEDGAPMQMFSSQIVTNTTKLPGGLKLPDKFEILNDSVQVIVCGDDAFAMPREQTAVVWFGQISWLQYFPDQKSVKICQDDLGGPGQWDGMCAGNELVVTTRTSISQLLKLSDFAHYADPLKAAMAGNFVLTDEKPLQVCQVFTKE